MITPEEIRELAEFEDLSVCALSFYFQPAMPRNKAHKEETILAKDLAREALRKLESRGNPKERCASAHADLDRILSLTQELRSNGHAKAIFACAAENFWREYDLPTQLSSTQLQLDRHFHLKPLAQLLGAIPHLGVVLLDRHRARLFDLRLGELIEREGFFHSLTRRGRSDGFAGYDGGHAERRVADEVRQHFKQVAEVLKEAIEKHSFDRWILGCLDTHWSQFEPLLHSDVSQKLIGHFPSDVAHTTRDLIRSRAEKAYSDWQQRRRENAVRETLAHAHSNGRGVTGLRRVLRSLELGEVQTLVISDNYAGQAVECTGCGHLDAHLISFCPVCGRQTREVVDVGEAILPWALRRNIELIYVKDDSELDAVGNIAAQLRYRSDKSKVQAIDEASSVKKLVRNLKRYRGMAAG
jgi:peptide subunit release factor 1 (eRF1)